MDNNKKIIKNLIKLKVFDKLMMKAVYTEQYKHSLRVTQGFDTKVEDNTMIFVLFSDEKTKETDEDIKSILNDQPIYYSGDVLGFSGPSMRQIIHESKDLLNVSSYVYNYEYKSVKDFLFKLYDDDVKVKNFMHHIDNDNNLKLMEGLKLDVEKIKVIIDKYTIDDDIEKLKIMIKTKKINKSSINRIVRRHPNNNTINTLTTKYNLWKYVDDFNKYNVKYAFTR